MGEQKRIITRDLASGVINIEYIDATNRSIIARLYPNAICEEHGTALDHARRIVACVNACAGMLDTEVSQGVVPLHRFSYVVNQRDELLAALASILENGRIALETLVGIRMEARAAIAKVKS